MKKLRILREATGLGQIGLARRAGVSRMRLQLAEAGEITLRPEELQALDRALQETVKGRVDALQSILVKLKTTPLETSA